MSKRITTSTINSDKSSVRKAYKTLLDSVGEQTIEIKDKLLRQTSIKAARLIRSNIAEMASTISPAGADIISKLKIEKRESWGSGHNLAFTDNGSVRYRMVLNPSKMGYTSAIGRNPVWALLVSNYGRKQVDAKADSWLAIATQDEQFAAKGKGGLPIEHRGDSSWYVCFCKSAGAVTGSNWMQSTVTASIPAVIQIMKGVRI